jgi:Protein of unknown function (DUF3152)
MLPTGMPRTIASRAIEIEPVAEQMPRARRTRWNPPPIDRTLDIVAATRAPGPAPAGIRPAVTVHHPEPIITPLLVSPLEELPRPALFRSGQRLPPPVLPVILPSPDIDAFFEALPGRDKTPPTKKTKQRRRRVALIAFVAVASMLVVGQVGRRSHTPSVVTIAPAASALPPVNVPRVGKVPMGGEPSRPSASPSAVANPPPQGAADDTPTRTVPTAGNFRFAGGYGPVLGRAGTVRRFSVAVEKSLGQDKDGEFAYEIDDILGDSRSWVSSRKLRLERVPRSTATDFTIYLASARTAKRVCATGGLSTGRLASCRLPGQVVINTDRWDDAVPDYHASLATYRAYVINHEVGHELGHGHEACKGKGRPAPVMQQQTYGLNGCVANGWPYIDGKRYKGTPIS